MEQLSVLNPSKLRKYVDKRVRDNAYIMNPHLTFAYLLENGDRSMLLRYSQEQVPISHQFLVALGELANTIVKAGIGDDSMDPRVVEVAYNVSFNLTEELCDPKARRSHVGLLGDYQKALLGIMGKGSDRRRINFSKSRATEGYKQAMTRGITNQRTGLLYLGVMEMWMSPEYDMLEEASLKAGVPKRSQVYFDANRDADSGRADTIGHADMSFDGAIQLAKIDHKWNVNEEELEQIINTSCTDRAKFWDQFIPAIRL